MPSAYERLSEAVKRSMRDPSVGADNAVAAAVEALAIESRKPFEERIRSIKDTKQKG